MKALRLPALVAAALLVGAALWPWPATAGPGVASSTPSTLVQWNGVFDTSLTPSDSTGAAGPDSYMEMVNDQFGIYDRSGGTIATGTLSSLAPSGHSADLSDPQVLWDPDTQRFYYSFVDFCGTQSPSCTNSLVLGWSKTSSPASSSDFCKFTPFDYGHDNLSDYPKLGTTDDFLLIGVNDYTASAYAGADVNWLTKPAAGSTCPSNLSTFKSGRVSNLLAADGVTQAFTPVPSRQVDTGGTGWVVAVPFTASESTSSTPASQIELFSVTKAGDGTATVQTTATGVTVAGYWVPPSADQPNNKKLDTLDGRLTNAVLAQDPAHGLALWTQHTVGDAGGTNARVRWYEVDPGAATTFQSGTLGSSSLHYFNASIAPDRMVNPGASAFGSNMAVGFDASSGDSAVTIEYVTKLGTDPVSAPVAVGAQSTGSEADGSCTPGPCRWGDYAGASPDPNVDPTAGAGNVWFTNAWVTSSGTVRWRTRNWEVGLGTTPPPPPTTTTSTTSTTSSTTTTTTTAPPPRYGGLEVDGWGGLHPFSVGSAPAPPTPTNGPYWYGWDIARGVAILPNGTGGYVLDGWGGLHPFSIGSGAPPQMPANGPYWSGWDIARGDAVVPDASGGYVVDGWGALHPFGLNGKQPPSTSGGPWWYGWDIARDVSVAREP